jgi:hypothetical protein
MPEMSGNATQVQTKRAEDIVNVLVGVPHRVNVMFIATDGDQGRRLNVPGTILPLVPGVPSS